MSLTKKQSSPLKFCSASEQAFYNASQNSLRRRNSKSSDIITTSNMKSARIVDIQTDSEFYTEVFSWGNDNCG